MNLGSLHIPFTSHGTSQARPAKSVAPAVETTAPATSNPVDGMEFSSPAEKADYLEVEAGKFNKLSNTTSVAGTLAYISMAAVALAGGPAMIGAAIALWAVGTGTTIVSISTERESKELKEEAQTLRGQPSEAPSSAPTTLALL